MKYLLDADVLIEAKRSYYAFDLCPGFWRFIEGRNQIGTMHSIKAIKGQLVGAGDELSTWARKNPSFFVAAHAGVAPAMAQVSNWVTAQTHYQQAAIATFLADPDAQLIAEALARGLTVVTRENREPQRQNRVKIPDVCDAVGVKVCGEFEVLRLEGAEFRL